MGISPHMDLCAQYFWSGVAGKAVSDAPATRKGELCATRLTRAGGFGDSSFVTCTVIFFWSTIDLDGLPVRACPSAGRAHAI